MARVTTIITIMEKKINKWALMILALCIMLSACTHKFEYTSQIEEQDDYHVVFFENKEYSYNTNLKNILVLGIDDLELNGQADFIGLFTLDRQNKKIYLTNIPRETKTTVALYEDGIELGESEMYLNMVYPFAEYQESGAKETKKVVSKILNGIPIDDYFVCSTTILESFAELFGDVIIELPNDSLAYLNPEWVTGYKFVVNKNNIELFLRSRDTKTNDSAKLRRERQNLYIKNVESKINEIGEEDILNILNSSLSSLNYSDIEAFIEKGYKEQDFKELPGNYVSTDYYDEFILDESKMMEFIIKMFYNEV